MAYTGTQAYAETVPAAPFVRLLKKRLALYEAEVEDGAGNHPFAPPEDRPLGPLPRLAADLGWHGDSGMRKLYRYLRSRKSGIVDGHKGDVPTNIFMRGVVEDALDHLGVPFHEVYPGIAGREERPLEPDEYCAICRETVTPIEGVCPWCETPIGSAPLPLGYPAVLERGKELYEQGSHWSFSVVADVMAEYHGFTRSAAWWSVELRRLGVDTGTRGMRLRGMPMGNRYERRAA